MQKIELAVTCEPLDSSREIISEALVEIAEICQKPITSALVQIWVRDLSDIPVELLPRALEQLRKTWTSGFLPTPGNVRTLIAEANAGGLQLEAEDAWEEYLTHVKRFFHPDIGWKSRAPHLSAIMEHAARAAGGPRWVEGCPESELQWARKRFIETYQLANETGQVEHLLTRGESKKILASLVADAQKPATTQLTAAPNNSAPASEEDLRELKRKFDELREKLGAAPPLPPEQCFKAEWPSPLSEEEIEKRKRDQRERFNRLLQEHPEISSRAEEALARVKEAEKRAATPVRVGVWAT